MMTFVAALHILVAVALIILVLVQDSKGGAMGGMFAGGSSNSILGATGAANLFVKATRVAAVLFAITCLWLFILTGRQKDSVMDKAVVPPAATTTETSVPVPAPTPEQK